MKLLFTFLVLMAAISGSHQREVYLTQFSPFKKAIIEKDKNCVTVTSKAMEAGIVANGHWDLTPYKAIQFTISNKDKLHPLEVYAQVIDSTCASKGFTRAVVRGKADFHAALMPCKTATYRMLLPEQMPYPEINQIFYDNFIGPRVRNTPYSLDYGQYKHKTWPGKVSCDEELREARKAEEKDLAKHPGPSQWSKYGGYLFWSHSVVRVTPSSAVTPLDENDPLYHFYFTRDELLHHQYTQRGIKETYDFSCANIYRKYGENYRQAWYDMAHRRLRSWGLNTIANSSDQALCLMDRTAIKAPASQACKKVFILELKEKYTDISNLNKAWGTSFRSWNELSANRDDVPKGAHKDLCDFSPKIAPNVLYMGCRFDGENMYRIRNSK